MQTVMERWWTAIEQDADYVHVVAKTRPGQKKRQERLAEAVAPFESQVMQDIETQQLGKSALIDYLGDETKAYQRAYAFGSSFILSVEVPGFEQLSESEQEHLHYEYAIKGIVWDALTRRLMVPELHAA